MARFHGLDWSEAFAFGLGEGLGIWYLAFPGLPASRMVHVRSQDIEARFVTALGLDFSWATAQDPEESEAALIAALDRNVPAIIQTDIFHLPYFGTRTHFPGHVITVWGYDAGRRVFFVTDTERDRLLEVDFDSMRRARHNGDGFFPLAGNLFAPETLPRPRDMAGITARAVASQSRAILAPREAFGGIPGLQALMDDLPRWESLPDRQWAARFAYQVIEKRGTGGGGFRLIYADFLEEAARLVPEVEKLRLPERMRALGEAWTALALALREASEEKLPNFSGALDKAGILMELSKSYHADAANLCGA